MNKRWIVGLGVALAGLVAVGIIAIKTSGFGIGKSPADENLLSDIRQYREQAGSLEPDMAAKRWFELYDRAAAMESRSFGADFYMMDHVTGDLPGVKSMLAALPPPAAWPAFRKLAVERAAAEPEDRAALSLKFLGELLDGDRDAASITLGGLEKAGAGKDLVISTRSLLARLYGDVEARVIAFQAELRAATQRSDVNVPDLHAMVGAERATALLTEALASPAQLKLEGGMETRALARGLALANLGQLKRAQWDLAADIEGASLYEALVEKFPRDDTRDDTQGSDSKKEAALYYFLRMVSEGRQADAERTLREVMATEGLSIPHAAVDALTRAQLNEPLYRFLHAQLERQPALNAWEVYIEQAAYTGHSAEALRLIDRLLARKDLDPALRATLRERRTAALLAADDIEAATAELLARFAKPPARPQSDLGVQFSAAIEAAAIGRLTNHRDLADAAIAFARGALKLPAGDEPDYELMFSVPKLYAELRRQGRETEALQIIEAQQHTSNDADEESSAEMEYFDSAYRFDVRPGLIEAAAIHSAAGRHSQVLELLANSKHWGATDLAEMLTEKDSLEVPLGAIVARALRATGDDAGALRVANATAAALPENDAAYEIIAALDAQAPQNLDARFALDEFEERPLIWKATFQLAHGDRSAAEETIRRAIAIDPSDGEEGPNDRMRVYAVLAKILRDKKDVKQAELYEGAVRAIRMSEHADELHRVGLYQQAFSQYRAALEQFSDAYCIQSRLAVQLNKQGRRSEALEHYRRAYELMPSSFGRVESHCFGCENVFQGSDQQSIAEQVFNDIIARAPSNAQARYLLAYLREQQGRYAEAVQPLRVAVSLDDHYLNAWKRLQDLADKTYIDASERDIARLKLQELDPLQRHAHVDLSEVGAFAQLWNGAARANAIGARAAPPQSGVYPLGAATRAHDAQLKDMPAESREQIREIETMAAMSMMYATGPAPPPSVVLGQHALVKRTQFLMGLSPRRGGMFPE